MMVRNMWLHFCFKLRFLNQTPNYDNFCCFTDLEDKTFAEPSTFPCIFGLVLDLFSRTPSAGWNVQKAGQLSPRPTAEVQTLRSGVNVQSKAEGSSGHQVIVGVSNMIKSKFDNRISFNYGRLFTEFLTVILQSIRS